MNLKHFKLKFFLSCNKNVLVFMSQNCVGHPLIISLCSSRENSVKHQIHYCKHLKAFSLHVPNIFPYSLYNMVQIVLHFSLSLYFPICCFTNIFSKLPLHFETSFVIKRNEALKKHWKIWIWFCVGERKKQ